MSYFFQSFWTALLQKLKCVKTWVPIVLLPLLAWCCVALLPQEEKAAPVQVGVAYPESGAEEFRDLLEKRSGTVVTFLASQEDEIRGKVATGQWDCGLILADDFGEKAEELDFDGMITLLVSDASTVYPLVREAVAACMAELTAPDMAREFMAEHGLYREDMQAFAETLLAQVLTEEDRILITMETASGAALSALQLADRTWNMALRGILAIVVLIWQLFAAVDLGRWLETSAAKRLTALRGIHEALLPRAAASLVPCLMAAMATLCILPDGRQALLPMACYAFALAALALAAARIKTIRTALPTVLPVLAAVCLLLSPVLIDIGAYVPAIAPLQACVPVTMFLRACGGSTGNMALLLLIAAAALALPMAADAAKGKGRRKA